MPRKTNLILIGIDSLRADHMSLYGYDRLTTPNIDKWAKGGTVFDNTFSAHIPTTSAYSNMLTGMDVFGTNVVALRHKGTFAPGVVSLAEILKKEGYKSTCVGFEGNPASRGFDKYINFEGWGSWEQGRSPKAENLNTVALPELKTLAKGGKPFFLFLRHMDPHSPYLPPRPFERMFYGGNEFDPKNKSMEPVFAFKPFCDFFACWMPPDVKDKDYLIAQYDGAVAYMDACIQNIFAEITALGLDEDTLVVLDSDHGETLYDHDCYFDHHGLYEPTLQVPLVFRLPGKVPQGLRLPGYTTLKSVTPSILSILGIKAGIKFDGQNLHSEMRGQRRTPETEFYITECTWMRKHGWRTPEWKLIHALEPDFHFKPEVELYNLIEDPEENHNLAKKEKKVAAMLEDRMQSWIARREKETGRTNPMNTNSLWHGCDHVGGPFKSSQQAYDTLHIGDPMAAKRLQAQAAKKR
jgi:arylsulfatase A-like enzyme